MRLGLIITFIVCALLTLAGCEKDFDVTGLEGDKKMVVNCQVDNLNNLRVFLTESVSPSGNGPVIPVKDAIVDLYINDSLMGPLPFVYSDSAKTFGAYELAQPGVPGNKYAVRVEHHNFGVVTAQDTLQQIPVVTNHQLVYYGDSSNGYRGKFRLSVADPAGKTNFYRINVFQWGRERVIIDGQTVTRDYGYSTRPELLNTLTDTIREYNTYLLFSDKSFNGQNKQIEFLTSCARLDDVLFGNFTVELMAVSEAHYNYYKSLENRGSFGSGSSAKPYSNINGGYGIFMTQSIYSTNIQVK